MNSLRQWRHLQSFFELLFESEFLLVLNFVKNRSQLFFLWSLVQKCFWSFLHSNIISFSKANLTRRQNSLVLWIIWLLFAPSHWHFFSWTLSDRNQRSKLIFVYILPSYLEWLLVLLILSFFLALNDMLANLYIFFVLF